MKSYQKFCAELVGTMFLVLLACGSAVLAGPSIGGYGIGVCFGLVLICLCYCIGNISGCHVNPAVSFAMWLRGKMNFGEFCMYVIAQLLGAVIGAAFLAWFVSLAAQNTGFTEAAGVFNFGGITGDASLAANVLQPGATPAMALVVETLLTFFFVFTVLGATDENHGFGRFAGLAIGIALGLVNIVGIPVDNCSVNPARSFGPAVFSADAWPDYWIMVVGPLLGAGLAVAVWAVVSAMKRARA